MGDTLPARSRVGIFRTKENHRITTRRSNAKQEMQKRKPVRRRKEDLYRRGKEHETGNKGRMKGSVPEPVE